MREYAGALSLQSFKHALYFVIATFHCPPCKTVATGQQLNAARKRMGFDIF